MMADSTNVEKPGYTMSEKVVGESFARLFSKAKGRIIIATFASNVHRIQQIIDAARLYDRKVAVSGRSMENIVTVATELGYLEFEKDILVSIDQINKYPNEKVVIITTGSQGEPMSALTRMANSEHRKVNIVEGDTPIPGNEKLVSRVINQLFQKGAEVIYKSLAEIHVSGHACQEELKLMQSLVRPKFFIPVHGEYRHLKQHGELAVALGLPEENILIPENGGVIEVNRNSIRKNGTVNAGQVFVDGLGVGDVGNIVLRDRKHLSQDGILTVVVTLSKENNSIIAGPDIISRGFVYVRESEGLMDEAKDIVESFGKHLKRIAIQLLLDQVKGVVNHLLGHAFFAVQHNTVDELGHQNAVVYGIRQDFSFGNVTSSGHFASLLHYEMISKVLDGSALPPLCPKGYHINKIYQ